MKLDIIHLIKKTLTLSRNSLEFQNHSHIFLTLIYDKHENMFSIL